jgi:diadenosine tetraphosphate (Ap4A) HIT family hydrolase
MSTETAIHRQVAAARAGSLPRVIARLASGWVVLGDPQVIRGYCLLLPDPVVPHLNTLDGEERRQFLEDMARVGDAVLAVTGAARINYEMLGNLEPALHAHVIPRHRTEPEALRTKPVWSYDWSQAPAFDRERDAGLMAEIADRISRARETP